MRWPRPRPCRQLPDKGDMVEVAVAVGWHHSHQYAWEKQRIVYEGHRMTLLVDDNLHQALLRYDLWNFYSCFFGCNGHLSEGQRSHLLSNMILCLDL